MNEIQFLMYGGDEKIEQKVVVSILENTTQHGAIKAEYLGFSKHQKIVSDFDKEI